MLRETLNATRAVVSPWAGQPRTFWQHRIHFSNSNSASWADKRSLSTLQMWWESWIFALYQLSDVLWGNVEICEKMFKLCAEES